MKASALLAGEERELELAWAAEEQRQVDLTQAERYARDPLAFLDSGHVWISSKFEENRPIRLQLYETQRETIAAWIDLDHLAATGKLKFRNMVEEKSRQMGETWAFAAVLGWLLHYHDVAGLVMHTRSAEVDDGGPRSTVRSLFGKVRYMDRRLGSATGLAADRQQRARVPGLGRLVFRPFSREPAKIENVARASVVYGEGQTDDPGRGGTFAYVVIDEAAFVTHGEKVYAALDEACPEGKALLSTVHGDDNMHARISDEAPKGWVKLRHHWSEHPIYSAGLHVAGDEADTCELCAGLEAGLAWDAQDPLAHRYPGRLTSPWYDERVIGKTDEQVAQELDIDRERALSGRVYPEFESDRHVAVEVVGYDETLPTELAFDYGVDVTSVLICQDHPQEYRVIGEVEVGDEVPGSCSATADNVAREIRRELVAIGVEARFTIPSWTRRMFAIGDPAGTSRATSTLKSDVDEYAKQGFAIGKPPTRLTRDVETSVRAVKRLLQGTPKRLVVSPRCEMFVRHIRNNTWPVDAGGRRRAGSTRPHDDAHNHMLRAFAYLAVAKFPPPLEPDETEPGPGTKQAKTLREKGVGAAGVRYGMSF